MQVATVKTYKEAVSKSSEQNFNITHYNNYLSKYRAKFPFENNYEILIM